MPGFRHLLRNSFVTEAERIVQELGALTAIDGATILNRSLALIASRRDPAGLSRDSSDGGNEIPRA